MRHGSSISVIGHIHMWDVFIHIPVFISAESHNAASHSNYFSHALMYACTPLWTSAMNVFICLHLCTRELIHICMCMHVCMHVCMYVRIYVRSCVRTSVCTCVCHLWVLAAWWWVMCSLRCHRGVGTYIMCLRTVAKGFSVTYIYIYIYI